MNPLLRLPYALAAQAARLGASLAPAAAHGKTWQSLRARRGIRERYAAWGRAHRDPARPLLWVHAPSVGEGLQARAVLPLVRALHPQLQIAYTFFSPSAEAFATSIGADFTDYLPFDSAGDADAALDALRPTALVFSKLDVWPTLVARAAARGTKIGMISATLADGSGRVSPWAKALLGDAYGALAAVGAIDAEDAARLIALGVQARAVEVTGDTRYDQVWQRALTVDRMGPLLATLASSRPTLVAGSTWPADEAVLLDAWAVVRKKLPGARLIIAPHEPTPMHLRPVQQWATDIRAPLARLGDVAQRTADVVLVDRTGVLGELYALADVAYVGGGFHAAGLHSVLEPAAFGAPVLFGPRHTQSRDAALLIAARGGGACTDAAALGAALLSLLTDKAERVAAGERARAMVERGVGAAERSAALVSRLLATS